MIPIKSSKGIELMKEGGFIAAIALKKVIENIHSGIKLVELDQIADSFIEQSGAEASFKSVEGYSYATCININEGIVHGLPSNYEVKKGDIVSVDLGVLFKGFHTDLSYTLEVESDRESGFLEAGKKALEKAISKCVGGNRIGDISVAIQETIEKAGYNVSRELVGHGVGEDLHEDPFIPGYGRKGEGPVLAEGMVFAIEVIYQKGEHDITIDEDGWTIKTADGSLSALFEHTVAITAGGPLVLTKLP